MTNNIEIRGEPFKANIINNDKHEIIETPLDSPSKPSIKFIAFVIPTIHTIVTIIAVISSVKIVVKKELKFYQFEHQIK